MSLLKNCVYFFYILSLVIHKISASDNASSEEESIETAPEFDMNKKIVSILTAKIQTYISLVNNTLKNVPKERLKEIIKNDITPMFDDLSLTVKRIIDNLNETFSANEMTDLKDKLESLLKEAETFMMPSKSKRRYTEPAEVVKEGFGNIGETLQQLLDTFKSKKGDLPDIALELFHAFEDASEKILDKIKSAR